MLLRSFIIKKSKSSNQLNNMMLSTAGQSFYPSQPVTVRNEFPTQNSKETTPVDSRSQTRLFSDIQLQIQEIRNKLQLANKQKTELKKQLTQLRDKVNNIQPLPSLKKHIQPIIVYDNAKFMEVMLGLKTILCRVQKEYYFLQQSLQSAEAKVRAITNQLQSI